MENQQAAERLMNRLFSRFDFLKEKWLKVGKALKVSEQLLSELNNRANCTPEDNLKAVIIKWIEENQGQLLFCPMQKKLEDSGDRSILVLLNSKMIATDGRR